MLFKVLENEVILDGEVQHQTVFLAVGRDRGYAVLEAESGGPVEHVGAVYQHLALRSLAQAGDDFDKLGLAVAVDAGDAYDLAAPHLEVETLDDFDAAIVQTVQILYVQHDITGGLFGLVDLESDLAADHHRGQIVFVHLFHVHGVDVLAHADDGAEVGGFLDLLELVCDDDNALAVLDKIVHDGDELRDLLRGEGGGRLIQDQDVRAAVERFQNFHALLHADGDILNLRVGVDGQSVTLGDFHHVFARRGHVQLDAPGGLCAEDDVFRDGEGLYQHEVLMYHADAGVDSVAGIVHHDLFAVNKDVAGGRLEQTVELVHQRRFARAVFAEDRVDFAFVDGEVDAVIGCKIAETLDNVAHFNDGRVHVHILFCQSDRPLSK